MQEPAEKATYVRRSWQQDTMWIQDIKTCDWTDPTCYCSLCFVALFHCNRTGHNVYRVSTSKFHRCFHVFGRLFGGDHWLRRNSHAKSLRSTKKIGLSQQIDCDADFVIKAAMSSKAVLKLLKPVLEHVMLLGSTIFNSHITHITSLHDCEPCIIASFRTATMRLVHYQA